MITEGPPPVRRLTITDDLIPTNQLVVILTPDDACYIDAHRDGNRCVRVGISPEEIGQLCKFLMNPEEVGPSPLRQAGAFVGLHTPEELKHRDLDWEECRFKGCLSDAEELVSTPVRLVYVTEGERQDGGDTPNVPLCAPHARLVRNLSGCDPQNCRFPFGHHASTCAAYVPYHQPAKQED